MSTIATATIQKCDDIVKISISNLSIKDKKLVADMLLDSFEFDDAYYDTDDHVIKVRMWDGEVDIMTLQEILSEIMQHMVDNFHVSIE